MNSILDKVVSVLVASILTALGTLALGVYTDFLPVLLPALQHIAPQTYLKIT